MPASTPTYSISGTISGLTSTGLVLAIGGQNVVVPPGKTGSFTQLLAASLPSGTQYSVAVKAQPSGQTCAVAGGTGKIGSANVANVVVTCADQAFVLGGTLSGLNVPGLVLANGSDTLTVMSGATSFTMPTNVPYTSSYAVTVLTQPAGVTCTVNGGAGVMPPNAVMSVSITCTDQPFRLGGTISGLGARSGLVLANGSDTLTVAANATSFVMPTQVSFGSAYSVTVQSSPSELTCTLSNGSGTMPASNVTQISVACSADSYTLGGTISGLTAGGLILANGSDTLNVAANATSFMMPSSVAYNSSYAVTVSAQPPGLTCSLSNASGTVGAAPVTDIAITCSPATYTLGGSISGLGSVAGLVLANGTDTLTVLANATSFTMPTGLAGGTSYNVTVKFNPTAKDCTVSNAAGTVGTADVTNVSVSCVAGTATVLHAFAGTSDGVSPQGSLIQANDGNLYGMTSGGGASNGGTVFQITPAGTLTVLHAFVGATDGVSPQGSLIQASDGNFYGMTSGGGANNGGTVFQITPAGTLTVLHAFVGATDGVSPQGSLIQASDGNFYGMTSGGGANNGGTVFQITPAGILTVLHAFAGATDGISPQGSLIQASDGNLYGMTSGGGANNGGTVFQITLAGTLTVLHAFAGATDGISPQGSLIQASDGTLYGMASGGGANNSGTVFQID
jgi:uncharacterized repeat protein (TIGR03803 family)